MIRVSDSYLENLLIEDVPYIDLTTEVLGIGSKAGIIEYFTREDAWLCGTEEVARIMAKLGVEVISSVPSGTFVKAGEVFLTAKGNADALHMVWKVCLNIFDHYSAITTKTHRMVEMVHAVNPNCQVLTTRKSMPSTKPLTIHAVMIGGAFPHRMGLGETILVFNQHLAFMGGVDGFIESIDTIHARCVEKKLFIESSVEDACRLAEAGVDGVQLDKVSVEVLNDLVPKLRAINPRITVIAAGGINMDNAAEYAATGVNGMATTALFAVKPLDMSVHMIEVEE